MSELGTVLVPALGGGTQRITFAAFVERFAAYQRKHYDELLEKSRKNIETLPLTDEDKRKFIAEVKADLDADHERCMREMAAMAARGFRLLDEPLQ